MINMVKNWLNLYFSKIWPKIEDFGLKPLILPGISPAKLKIIKILSPLRILKFLKIFKEFQNSQRNPKIKFFIFEMKSSFRNPGSLFLPKAGIEKGINMYILLPQAASERSEPACEARHVRREASHGERSEHKPAKPVFYPRRLEHY